MRTPEQRAAARAAQHKAAAKLRQQGYRFGKRSATEAETVAAIQRVTGWPAPNRGEAVEFMAKFAALEDGTPAPARRHDALHAPAYRLDRCMLAQAARAARDQRPLTPAVSKIGNTSLWGDGD